MDVSVVRFRPEDFAEGRAGRATTEIAKYFEAHKAQLKTDEKRKVKFVRFGLTDEQKKLKGKERIDVLQKLADKANDFTEALQAKGADFDQVAAKFQITPKETGDFSKASPDPELASTPQLVQAAFALTKESPNSDAIQTPDGFDLLHLVNVEPSRPLTLGRSATADCRGAQETNGAADGRDEGGRSRAQAAGGFEERQSRSRKPPPRPA